MKNEISKLLELRKEYPVAGYLAIAAILVSLVLGIVAAANGSYVPLIVGLILFIFLGFLLVVFSRVLAGEKRGFNFWLAILLLTFITVVFMVWIVLLTLAALCLVQIAFIKMECAPTEINVTGSLQPSYTLRSTETESESFRHYRSSCSGRSSGTFRTCLPQGYSATGASVLDLWAKNDNGGTGEPYPDPNSARCYQVDWNAASGGTTGIGECRYHGDITFDLQVVGFKDDSISGPRENFEGVLRNESTFRYPYSEDLPSGANNISWDYAAEVSFQGAFMEPAWTSHLSDEMPQDGCISSEITTSTIRLRAAC